MTFDEETHEIARRRFWMDIYLAVIANEDSPTIAVTYADRALKDWDKRFCMLSVTK